MQSRRVLALRLTKFYSKISTIYTPKEGERYLQVAENLGWLGYQEQVFQQDLNAEAHKEVFEGVPDHVFKAAMVVLAHMGLVQEALGQHVIDQAKNGATLGLLSGFLVKRLLGGRSLLWEVMVLKLMLPLIELVLNLGNLA